MVFRHLHLCFTPPSFHGADASFPPTARFLAHQSTPGPQDRLPPWLGDLPDGPAVLVTIGTVFHRTPGLHEAILAILRDEPINRLIALGFEQDPSRLGARPVRRTVKLLLAYLVTSRSAVSRLLWRPRSPPDIAPSLSSPARISSAAASKVIWTTIVCVALRRKEN